MFKYIKEHRRGIIGTTLFHLILIVFFILYKGFSTPLPLPDEEGIFVNFGMEESGSGAVEPTESATTPVEEEAKQPEESIEEVQPETVPEEVPTEAKEEILTQETEEAPEVDAAEQKRKTEEEAERKRIEEERRREQERIAELKRIEEQRIRDSVEQAKREEQARILQERISKQMAKGDENSQSTSDGNTGGTGNQGDVNGDPNAGNYTGSGKGEGVSFSLAGRNYLTLPEPEYMKQESGYIVVEVIVDRTGNVVDAIPGKKGTTITDNKLMEAARKAALKAKFDTKADAPPRQTGTITYHFVLE
jgi:TonB family protein